MQCRGAAASASGGDVRATDRATLHYRARRLGVRVMTSLQLGPVRIYVHRAYSLYMSHCLEATTTHSNRRVRLGRCIASHNLKTSIPISGVFDSVGTAVVDHSVVHVTQPASYSVCIGVPYGTGSRASPDFQQFSFFQFTLLTPDSNFVRLPLQTCIVFVFCNNISVVVQSRLHDHCSVRYYGRPMV